MNSKLPPKYTILFLLLFILNSNKGECALKSAELYPALLATTGEAYFISTPSSFVSDSCIINSDNGTVGFRVLLIASHIVRYIRY
ncbi:hypothetical protein AMR72_06285 [Flavobacterium psychrophilum]|nr:hypothetical protein AMR72_06285 [Flavobacterium psychrophilum]AOE52157.1 hypothetical protein ALW18_06275 [Flavobacterium psychrophilum]